MRRLGGHRRPTAMSASVHSLRWFARPLVLAVGALLTLFALTGGLTVRYLHERQAANLSLEPNRHVLDTPGRLPTIVANLAARKRAESVEQRKTWLIAAAVVIVALFAGTALALARREAKRRRKATEENVQLYSDLEARDKKIRHLFDANIIGIIIWDVEGRIFEANDAFPRTVRYDRTDLPPRRLHRTHLTPPEWRDRDARTVAELTLVGTVPPFEKEYFRKDGSRVPVLIGGAMVEEGRNHGGGFVLVVNA